MRLVDFFAKHPKIALAFSGGVDSSYLLYAAKKAGADVKAYYAKSDFQPEFEFKDAKLLAAELGADMEVIYLDVLADPVIVSNPADRCYTCKKHIMGAIMRRAAKDGYDLIVDGTNASDDLSDRPGVKALMELGVRSPLLEAGLTKDEIRRLSKEAGLFTWDKPAYACLATRILTGEELTFKKLKSVEACEAFMMDMGFRDFRVRVRGKDALIQIKEKDFDLYKENEEWIKDTVREHFRKVELDPVFR